MIRWLYLVPILLSGCAVAPVKPPVQTPVMTLSAVPKVPVAPTGLAVAFVKDASGNLIANGDAPWAITTNSLIVTPPVLPAARMVARDVPMVATPSLVMTPAATPNATISWDARTDVDGFIVNIGGQVQILDGTASSLDTWLPTNQPTRCYVSDFLNVPQIVTAQVQGHTIYITNEVTASAPAMALFCPPNTVDLQYQADTAFLTFKCIIGAFVKAQCSASFTGPYADTGWQLVCNDTTNYTFAIPQRGTTQQFFKLLYAN